MARPLSCHCHPLFPLSLCLAAERRVVPLDDGVEGRNLTLALQEKPYAVVSGTAKGYC
jgi:hypothetical protein